MAPDCVDVHSEASMPSTCTKLPTHECDWTCPLSETRSKNSKVLWLSAVLAIIGLVSLTTSVFIQLYTEESPHTGSIRVAPTSSLSEPTCTGPNLRREWRTLTPDDQKSYISAVLCLNEQASRLDKKHPLSADFPYAHIWYARDVHDGVRFLAYHRWFIHLYETALRRECGYRGHLTYWDWTLDWEDPYTAAVFDVDNGFGDNGDAAQPGYVGYCIGDGPLKNYSTPYKNELRRPHCLSRNFTTGQELESWKMKWHPRELERVLNVDDWVEFNEQVEDGMHIAMPWLIGGDFKTQGSPAEPLFFLHHTQLDRILWMWQQRKPEMRIHGRLGGQSVSDEERRAKFASGMFFGDLGSVVAVVDVMDIQGGPLCYRY